MLGLASLPSAFITQGIEIGTISIGLESAQTLFLCLGLDLIFGRHLRSSFLFLAFGKHRDRGPPIPPTEGTGKTRLFAASWQGPFWRQSLAPGCLYRVILAGMTTPFRGLYRTTAWAYVTNNTMAWVARLFAWVRISSIRVGLPYSINEAGRIEQESDPAVPANNRPHLIYTAFIPGGRSGRCPILSKMRA
jgi:hypothetical protein